MRQMYQYLTYVGSECTAGDGTCHRFVVPSILSSECRPLQSRVTKSTFPDDVNMTVLEVFTGTIVVGDNGTMTLLIIEWM